MSVLDRAALFESLPRTSTPAAELQRSKSDYAVPLIEISHEDDPVPELPPRPGLALRPHQTSSPNAKPSLKPKPTRLKSRPTVPPKLPTDDGVLTSRPVAGEDPPRIELIDREDEEISDDARCLSSQLERDLSTAQQSSPKGSSPSRSPRQNAIDKARQRTILLAGSAIDIGREKSKVAAQAISQSANVVGQTAVKLKDDTVQAIEKSGAPKAIDQAAGSVREGAEKVKIGADNWIEKLGIPRGFARTSEDFQDIQAKYFGKEGLCTKCRTLPIELCYPTAEECQFPEVLWATTLPRIIYHASWCRLCNLLIQMLCRSENDPLKDPAVESHLPDDLKGMSFQQWIGNGWYFTDKHWPFGYGDKRHEGATNILGGIGSVISQVFVRASTTYLNSGGGYTVWRTSKGARVSLRKPKTPKQKTKYPLSCALRVAIRTHADFESPGLLFVDVLGSSCGPVALPFEKRFHLRVANPKSLIRDLSQGPLSYGCLLDQKWIDISTIRKCLEACERHHGKQCSEHGWKDVMWQPKFIRVLDVVDLCIVTPADPAICRFIALSYVWGGIKPPVLTDYDTLKQSGSLRKYMNAMPRTIVDTFEVVKSLGERYLWVDALCIPQNNLQEAQEQIEHMDRIYGSALLTIVASEGENANSGLHGVRRRHFSDHGEGKHRTLNQPSAEIRDNIHIIAPFPNDQNIESSAWNTRAWTFQERLLSKRFLVFGANEVTWHCRAMTAREDMLVKDSGYGRPLQGWLSLRPEHLGINVAEHWKDGSFEITRHGETRLVRSGGFHEYVRMIEQYTHRKLTYDSDMLNALAGLLQIFEHSFKSSILFGLPEVLFDVALLWRPTEQLKLRRDAGHGNCFPSWSWAGWKGKVAYEKPYTMQSALARSSPVRFAVEDYGEEGVRPFVRWYKWTTSLEKLRPLNGNGIGLPLDERNLPREWENTPPSAKDSSKQTISRHSTRLYSAIAEIKLQNNHLVFETSCSQSFQFGDAISQASDKVWNASSPPLRYALTDAEFERVGTILLDGNGPDWLDSDRHEFILLGEAQFFGLDDERHDIDGYPLYLALLVQWDNRTKVAYRIGLARITKTAWKAAESEMKPIVLG